MCHCGCRNNMLQVTTRLSAVVRQRAGGDVAVVMRQQLAPGQRLRQRLRQRMRQRCRGMAALLSREQEALVDRERRLLRRVQALLMELQAPEESVALMQDSLARLQDRFTVMVMGEFNSGKSTFINVLLGGKKEYARVGVLPTTARVAVFRAKDSAAIVDRYRPPLAAVDTSETITTTTTSTTASSPFGPGEPGNDEAVAVADDAEPRIMFVPKTAAAPVAHDPLMDDVDIIHTEQSAEVVPYAIVDTPGTNAVIQRHQELAEMLVPRADLILFLTSVERPFTESERHFLERISGWRKKVILILNKIDLVADPADRESVASFVRENGRLLLGGSVTVFPLSANQAFQAKQSQRSDLWSASRFQDLEEYMHRFLSHEELIRSKLSTPLGVADRVVADALATLEERRRVLQEDQNTLRLVDEQMAAFKRDMERDILYHRMQISRVFDKAIERSNSFLQNKVSVFNASYLINSEAMAKEYELHVMHGVSSAIDLIVKDLADTVTERARHQSAAITEFVGRRPDQYEGRIVGRSGMAAADIKFSDTRQSLQQKLRTAAEVSGVNPENDDIPFERLTRSVRQAVLQAAALEVAGAATIGGLLATAALDLSGIAVASTLAVAGLFVLPHRRSSIQSQFRSSCDVVQERLSEALGDFCGRELHRNTEAILDSINPYRTFVEVEHERIESAREQLGEFRTDLSDLRAELGSHLD